MNKSHWRIGGNHIKAAINTFLLFRVLGMLTLAVICLLVPAVGDNREWVAMLLALAAPTAVFVGFRYRTKDNGWADPLFDLTVTLIAIQLVPQVWHAALCLGLMIALAPSASLHPRSHIIYTCFGLLLILGMSATAIYHEIEGWHLSMLAITAVYPSVIYYSLWQVKSAGRLRERSDLLASMNQLAGSVAHDFNNTLMGISGHAELALMELDKHHPATDAMESVVDAATRASLLSRQLLAFTGRDQANQRHWDLNSEIQMITALLAPVVPKGVEIHFDSSVPTANVEFDRAELQQVLMNVILNAGEAMQDHPDTIKISLTPGLKGWVQICVEDSGTGISPANLPNVFDPYFTSKEQGHGLGLATAKSIMQKHGGKISLVSDENTGTEVSLQLPLSTDPLQESLPHNSALYGTLRTALVVDDEVGVLSVTSRYLQSIGFTVTKALNTDEALSAYQQSPDAYDIVILDLNMPGRDGWACLREIRSLRPDQAVVICSGFDPAQESNSLFDQTIAFLPKPFRLQELRSAIGTAHANAG